MSGIYIPVMEMPKSCVCCGFFRNGYMCDYCYLTDGEIDNCDEIHKCCPLIPVPNHGDLIDRDALMKLEVVPSENWVFRAIEKAPTIIPADKEAGE